MMASSCWQMVYAICVSILIGSVRPLQNTSSSTVEPTAAPSENPTFLKPFCNIFDGTTMDNSIQVTYNSKISDLEMTDPLRIKFNFAIYSPDVCITEQCNLIQFGSSTESVLFPRVSISNQTQNAFEWFITLQVGNNANKIVIPQNFSFPGSSSFDITISDKTVDIVIGATHYSNTLSFTPMIQTRPGLHPFYVSSDCCSVPSFNAAITQLCISMDSLSPTKIPTGSPTHQPTTAQPTAATTTKSFVSYNKIDCYSETGTAGASTVQCTTADYFATSCGIKYTGVDTYDDTFFRGIYIERMFPNQLLLEPICFIDYDTVASEIRSYVVPQARCCNFKQQYGDAFNCLYFNSRDVLTAARFAKNQRSSEKVASKANEVSYVTCNDEYPFLLGCMPYIVTVDAVPNTTSDIYVYGSFVAEASAQTTDTYYNKYYSLFNQTIAFPPTTFAPTASTASNPTTQPTVSPIATVSFTIASPTTVPSSQYAQCVAQYGPTTHNYSLMAIATCCTQSYNATAACCQQPTPSPTSMPTMPPVLSTDLYGRGVNFGADFTEGGSNGPITGIIQWGIFQVIDESSNSDTTKIPYQGLLIGEYRRNQNLDGNQTENIVDILSDSDYGNIRKGEFEIKKECASFDLDKVNGIRDYIDGFDLFWTRFAIIGVRFYSKFGRVYSCPDDQNFTDDSIQIIFPGLPVIDLNERYLVRTNDYNVSNVSVLNAFAVNGTYQLSGWWGTKQTRELYSFLERSVMAKMGFIFLLDASTTPLPTASPTASPTHSPTPSPTDVITPSPLFPGQSPIGSETLECYAIFGESHIKCSDKVNDTMTSCSGYSANGQVFSTYIDDYSESVCNAETLSGATKVAASAVCCHFYVAPARDYNIFIWTAISGGVIYFIVLLVIGGHWCCVMRPIKYFNEADIDKDELIDEAWESDVNAEKAKKAVEDKKAKRKDLEEMIELERQVSNESIGLI